MSWRRASVAFGLLGLVVGVGVWLGHGPRTSRSSSGRASMPAPSLRTARIVPPFAWLGQRGVEGRRIAGRVIHAGRPVPNAVVRLTTEALGVGEWPLAEVETDEAGRFDLGVRSAIRYLVDHDAARPARLTVERNGGSFTFEVPPEGSLDRR
jgi:hypothetical protein